MMGTDAKLTACILFAALLTKTKAQTEGLKLSLDHDMISRGVQDKFGQLTCQAYGNEVNIESFTVIWVKVTGEATDLITVTPSSPSNRVSQDGIYGNGTLKENNGYISLDQMDAAICGSSYFLCEASFTNSAGERERAIAMARPGQPHKGYSDQRSSNATDSKDVAALEKKVEDMTEAFRIFNSSYSTLLQTRQKEQQEQRKTLSRISMLEDKVSKLNGSQSCDPCSNITQAVENLEKRLEQLEDGGDDHGNPGGQSVCVRGMKNTTQEEYIIYTDEDLGKQIRCDAHTDGGGWIVFQRQAFGEVDFNRTWNEYRKGFGNLTTDFWLGNEAIYKLTNASAYELRVDFKGRSQGDQFAQYKTFKIMDEINNYRLLLGQHVAGTTNEDSTSGLANHNNQDFTTVDRDNDGTPFNCAKTNQGGWWYSNCGLANFNSRLPPKYNIGIISYRSADRYYSPIFVEIKMRLL